MKKMIKSFYLILVAGFVIVLLAACGGRNLTEEIVGTWVVYPETPHFEFYFIFNADGTGYGTHAVRGQNGSFDWEIIDEDLHLKFHDWSDQIWNEITIEGDTLTLDQFQDEESGTTFEGGRPLNFNR